MRRPSFTTATWRVTVVVWLRTAARAWRNGREDNLNVLAAGIAFYAFLALLPFVVAIATIYGMFAGVDRVAADTGAVLSVLPNDAAGLLARRVTRALANNDVGPVGVTIALAFAAYSAARGARALVSALNVMRGVRPRPKFVERWSIAVVIALTGAGLMLLALVGIALQSQLGLLLPSGLRLVSAVVRTLFWALLSVGVSAGLAVLYRYGPAGQAPPWRWLIPGALAATVAWLVASLCFETYVSRFDRLDATYGPLAAAVVLQLWLYLSAFAVLYGAKLNAEAEREATLQDERER
jgi:membrane protein